MHSRYILNYVAQMFEVSPTDIQQQTRGRQSVAKARDVYFYLLEATGKSHNEIAKMGRRERSSVTCAIKRTKEAMKKEEFLIFPSTTRYYFTENKSDNMTAYLGINYYEL